MKKFIIISLLLLSTLSFAKKESTETYIEVDCQNRTVDENAGWETDGQIKRVNRKSGEVLEAMSVTVRYKYEVVRGLDILSIKNASCTRKIALNNAENEALTDIVGTYSNEIYYGIVFSAAPDLGWMLRDNSDIQLCPAPKGIKEFFSDMFSSYGPTIKNIRFIYSVE